MAKSTKPKEKCPKCGKEYLRLAAHIAMKHEGKRIGAPAAPGASGSSDTIGVPGLSGLGGEVGRILKLATRDKDERGSALNLKLYLKGPSPAHEAWYTPDHKLTPSITGEHGNKRPPVWRRVI